MGVIEFWHCDYHAEAIESEDDVVLDDVAIERGWIRIERKVTRQIVEGGMDWTHVEVCHVCADCLKDPDCIEWIDDGGYMSYYEDDQVALDAARAAVATERARAVPTEGGQ